MFSEESFDWFRANIKWDFVPDFNSIERNESLFKVSSCFGDSKFCFAACRVSGCCQHCKRRKCKSSVLYWAHATNLKVDMDLEGILWKMRTLVQSFS